MAEMGGDFLMMKVWHVVVKVLQCEKDTFSLQRVA